MRENLAEKYMAMSQDDINLALFSLHDESSRLNNTIDKLKFESCSPGLDDIAKISRLGRKLRFVNTCILIANKCLGMKGKQQRMDVHFATLNAKFELLKLAAKSKLSEDEFNEVWSEFLRIEMETVK